MLLPGSRFGRLVVVSENGRARKERKYLCRCDCGASVTVAAYRLRTATRSCGCLQKERASQAHKTHGLSSGRSYLVWRLMFSRCYDTTFKQYKDYGGRGIRICARWHDVAAFVADMGERPIGMQIDRIDNSGDYSPENCQWVTRSQNMLNRRVSYLYTHEGERISLRAAATWLLMSYGTFRSHLLRAVCS